MRSENSRIAVGLSRVMEATGIFHSCGCQMVFSHLRSVSRMQSCPMNHMSPSQPDLEQPNPKSVHMRHTSVAYPTIKWAVCNSYSSCGAVYLYSRRSKMRRAARECANWACFTLVEAFLLYHQESLACAASRLILTSLLK